MVAKKNEQPLPKDGAAQPQPGDTISPGAAQPQPVQQAVSPATTENAPKPTEVTAPASVSADSSLPSDDTDAIRWTASEFIAHEKSASWYAMLAVGALVVAAIIFLLTRDKVSAGVVLIGALMLGIYGARQPRQLEYKLNGKGFSVGDKYHSFEEFRSFAVVPEGAFSSIIFMPLKRFAQSATIYYAPEDEDKIIDLLADRLPIEEHTHDPLESFMRRIRF